MHVTKFHALMAVPVLIFCYKNWAIERSDRIEGLKWFSETNRRTKLSRSDKEYQVRQRLNIYASTEKKKNGKEESINI
jgi:hypothetical protein